MDSRRLPVPDRPGPGRADSAVTLPPLPTREEREATFADYVRWGDQITDQLKRDGLVTFHLARDGSAVPAW